MSKYVSSGSSTINIPTYTEGILVVIATGPVSLATVLAAMETGDG